MQTGIVPFADLERMALTLFKAGMFKLKTPEQAIGLMLIAQSEGLHPVTALRRYHIMEDGRPSMKSEIVLAGFQRIGGEVVWLTEADDRLQQRARWTYKGNSKEIGFTIVEAQAAGYVKQGSNWVKDPAAQLRARAITRAVRMLAPSVLDGLRTPEELADIPPDPPGNAPTGWTAAPASSPAPAADKGATASPAAQDADFTPAPAPAPAPVASAGPAASEQGHPAATADQGVPGLFGPEDAPIVLDYLLSLGWIRAGQTFEHLNKGHEARIRKGLSPFLAAARKAWAAKNTPKLPGGK